MIEKSLFKRAFVVLFAIGFMSFLDSKLYLTWIYWWFDMVMHFSAGGVVGMATVLYCIYFSKFLGSKIKIIFYAALAGFVVGFAWELFELYFGLATFNDGMSYLTDTLSDLSLDMLGSILFSIYSTKFIKK